MLGFRNGSDVVEDSFFVKLIDQGVTVDLKKETQAYGFAGTLFYMAPENIALNSTPRPASDVYSFGIMLMENFAHGKFEDYRPYTEQFMREQISFDKYISERKRIINMLNSDAIRAPDGVKAFVCNLIKHCCACKPAERITAAQASVLLQVLRSAIESNPNVQLTEEDFRNALEFAKECRPKSIPLALREMMQSSNLQERDNGCKAILQLGGNDPSYQATPSYGLALLRGKPPGFFYTWCKNNPEIFLDLQKRSVVKGNEAKNNEDIEVSQEEKNIITQYATEYASL